MVKPQQQELQRSGRGATDESSAKSALQGNRVGPTADGPAPIPEDNQPGHHPEVEQDKPSGPPPRPRTARPDEAGEEDDDGRGERSAEVIPISAAGGEVRRRHWDAGPLRFDGLEAGPVHGEPVLLLHGFPQSSQTWRPLLSRLAAEGLHAAAPDQRGYSPGARPRSAAAYGMDHLVEDALTFVRSLGDRPVHVVGHDWGGAVAWALAAAHPEAVRSLTVVSTPHPRALLRSLGRSTQALRSSYVLLFNVPAVPELLLGAGDGALFRRALTSSGLDRETAEAYWRAMSQPGALSGALRWYRSLRARPRPMHSVGTVRVPTTFVWSPADTALGPSAARSTGDFVEGPYRFEVLDRAGHWIPETRGDDLARIVLERIRSVR